MGKRGVVGEGMGFSMMCVIGGVGRIRCGFVGGVVSWFMRR